MFLFLNPDAMTDAELQPDDPQLLRDYVERRSGSAFAELVRRHVDAVYSAAVRRANGDRALAEDITQCVFTDFARKAAHLPPGTVPGGWLHRHTGFVASHHIDRERRRRAREQQAVAMNALTDSPADAAWRDTAPLLDAALDALPAPDRDAIVLRFFEKRDFRAVGQALGVSDDTAQKRVSRALEKLRALLTRRGVTGTAAGLSALMLAHTVTTAPAALASSLPARALAGAAAGGGTLMAAIAGLGAGARWRLAGVAALVALAGASPFLLRRTWIAGEGAHGESGRPAGVARPLIPPRPETPAQAAVPPPSAPGVAEIIAAAAKELSGGAQNFTATTRSMSLLSRISPEQAEEALGLVAKVPDGAARALLYKFVLGHWAEVEPWKAAVYAATAIPEELRVPTTEGVLTAWAARDPEGVLGWNSKSGGTTTVPPMSDSLLAAVFKGLASRDLARTFEYLKAMDNGPARAQALRGILDTLRTPEDRERLLARVALQEPELRIQSRRAVVESWARREPEQAAEWIGKVEPAWERPRLMDSLGFTWLQSNPAAAAAWWIAREPGPDTLVKVINVWSQRDPNEAGRWLATQPPGPQSDTARMTFARQVADLDPESALQWASTVTDEAMRRAATEHILTTWRARDPAAAALHEAKAP